MRARLKAVEILYEIEKREGYANLMLRSFLPSLDLSQKEKSFITELVYGILRWQLTLDAVWKRFVKKPDDLSLWSKILLRMAVYHKYFLENTILPVAMNELVEIAKMKAKKEKNLINAVIRKIVNENYDFSNLPEDVKLSHPQWILDEWKEYLGDEIAIKIAEANNFPAPISIRVNKLKTNKEELKKLLEKDRIKYRDGLLVEDALIIENGFDFENYELFKKGYFTVQSEASMLTSLILNPKPGERVADLCSAPGTKSTHLAELMNNRGKIVSIDKNSTRIKLIEKNAKRLGISIIETLNMDVLSIPESLDGTFDKVLLDAPCTGLGVLRHKPEIKWRRKREDVYELSKLQLAMLKRAGKLVKRGGEILYSTCTLTWQENETVVLSFLKENINFKLKNFHFKDSLYRGFLKIIPYEYNTDGFFIALIKNEG
ncbi:MAG: 16S rRNA (cytosine(967)-C(5))-methyltransferase [Dictyoglomus sp. NZ13-RE01]|nr:MAG: 16S rRNA (cytosine(967)-C(5))-methyltransferase [Dictyoglomus sp. NZ13-RE01]